MMNVYLEIGKKRTCACALDWPGWCRIGRDEETALQALLDSAPRYARVLHVAHIAFQPPADVDEFRVVERLAGTVTTDFGVPDIAPPGDARAIDSAELERLQALLKAYWRAFDAATRKAAGKELRKGPRGGGRDLDGIVEHVLGAEAAYVRRLGRKVELGDAQDRSEKLSRSRQAAVDALAAAARGETPTRGPRGGVMWLPRYFVRRAGWHVLDHAWEVEDRIT